MNNVEFSSCDIDVNAILYLAPGYMYWKDKNLRYLGCNRNFLEIIGLDNVKDLIGKTDYDMPWSKVPEIVEKYIKDDKNVIETHSRIITEDQSIIIQAGVEVNIFVQTAKTPLFNNNGKVVGVLGVAINVTDAKVREKIEQENQAHMIRAEEDEKFRKIVGKVAHDIRAPIMSTLAIAKSAAGLPESMRITLRSAANRVNDLANGLLNYFDPESSQKNVDTIAGQKVPLLVSGVIKEILGEKRVQHNEAKIIFDEDINQGSHFAFINVEAVAFKRTLSNLINNAVDALDKELGKISIGINLIPEDRLVKISIKDNGKGISPELVEKIRSNVDFTEGKEDGHGIGLSQVREMLERNNGEFAINSEVGVGTEIILTFRAVQAPKWIAEEMTLQSGDIVVILDDDSSIHGAWDAIFENYISDISLKHFDLGGHVVEYVNGLTDEQKQKIFLLVDYELLGQGLNGLDVVEQTGITRSILVTSHHENKEIQNMASKTNTKILPKLLAPEIPISVVNQEADNNKDGSSLKLKHVDLVIIDDNEEDTQILKETIFKDKKVDSYVDLVEFLQVVHQYPKDTKMLIDNNYDNYYGELRDISPNAAGFDIAKRLHKDGYTDLNLHSGDTFKKIPEYLKVINKVGGNEVLETLFATEKQLKDKLDLNKHLPDIIYNFEVECNRLVRAMQEDIIYKTDESKESDSEGEDFQKVLKEINSIAVEAREVFYFKSSIVREVNSIFDKLENRNYQDSDSDLVKCNIRFNAFGFNLDQSLRLNEKSFKNNVKQLFDYMGNVIIVDVILYSLLRYVEYQIRQGNYNTGNIELYTNIDGNMNELILKYFAKGVLVKSPETNSIFADNYAFCVNAMKFFEGSITTRIVDDNSLEFVLAFPKIV